MKTGGHLNRVDGMPDFFLWRPSGLEARAVETDAKRAILSQFKEGDRATAGLTSGMDFTSGPASIQGAFQESKFGPDAAIGENGAFCRGLLLVSLSEGDGLNG